VLHAARQLPAWLSFDVGRKHVKLAAVIFLGILWCATHATGQPLEFSGYLKMSGDPQFILTDLSSKKASGWLKRGQSFAGYLIADFDPEREILSVTNSKEVVRLYLKQSKVENREASLASILKEQEDRLARGQSVEEGVFLSRIALYSFRRDSSPTSVERVRIQELIVSEHEKREAHWKSRRAMGVATDLDTLEKTEDLLRARVQLAEHRAGAR
jgi:hypothetical protein